VPNKNLITPDRAVLACLALTVAVYCRTLRYDFILDDVPLIMMNDSLSSWHNWKTVLTSHIFSAYGGYAQAIHYRPVYIFWLMANRQLFGMVLPWWHLTSILLHLGSVVLVYQLALKLVRAPWTAVLSAFIFALLPIHVESVAYVAVSTDLLVSFFLLASLLFYLRFRETNSVGTYLFSITAAALAMFSKESAALFPIALISYEFLAVHPTAPDRARRMLGSAPFFAIVTLYFLVRTFLFGAHIAPGSGLGFWAAIGHAPLVSLVYLRNLLCPFGLSFFYPSDWILRWTALRAAGVLVMLFAIVAAWFLLRREHRISFLWMAIFLLPALAGIFAFVPEDWVHDRHMYLGSTVFCIILASLVTQTKLPRQWAIAAASGLLGMFLVLTSTNIPRFHDDLTLYESALKVAPDSQLAHTFYAFSLSSYGHKQESLREFQRNTEMFPSGLAFERYGEELVSNGRGQDAAVEFANGLRLERKPTWLRAQILYRLALLENGISHPASAEVHLREALLITPDAVNYHTVLAASLRAQGRPHEADKEMRLEEAADRQYLKDPPALRQ
jgi:4-amino-4-deoxy-L-arabinose transferase-like glycosyltransferase